MLITAKNLTFAYNRDTEFATYALKNVSLDIGEGEFFGVIGHTGSGKSTFIQHLNALIEMQDGELYVGGRDLKKRSKKDKKGLFELRKNVGMVFQYPEYQLFAETVFEDVAFGIKNFNKGISDDEVSRLVLTALRKVGLNAEEVINKSPFDLSGGQKRKVAIAGVIAVNPEILILDEPCAGLDPAGKKELWALLHELHRSTAKTVIIVSHDMNDVAEHCTRAAVFYGGTVKAVGTPKELFSNASLIKECGLEIPLTATLTNALGERGIVLDTDYKTENFIGAVTSALGKDN